MEEVCTLGSEAHKSIYVYCILHAIAKSFNSQLLVLAERYVEGSKAKGNVDYSIELRDGEILGVTEVKEEEYMQGIAQNAMEIRSALEYNRKRKRGETSEKSRCFGIATDVEHWYFLEYIAGHIPKVSKKYQGMVEDEFQKEKVKQISGIINWLLKEGLEQPTASEPAIQKSKNRQVMTIVSECSLGTEKNRVFSSFCFFVGYYFFSLTYCCLICPSPPSL
ncbi:hypothetical protein BGX38DRAFT_101183 [Terfezia claveryi]|nr:hypothetical protein BGX38DRAFT_101183 [Terfezia claveryi]